MMGEDNNTTDQEAGERKSILALQIYLGIQALSQCSITQL